MPQSSSNVHSDSEYVLYTSSNVSMCAGIQRTCRRHLSTWMRFKKTWRKLYMLYNSDPIAVPSYCIPSPTQYNQEAFYSENKSPVKKREPIRSRRCIILVRRRSPYQIFGGGIADENLVYCKNADVCRYCPVFI